MTHTAVVPESTLSRSSEELTLAAWWEGVRSDAPKRSRHRYSVSKARRLLAYLHTTSTWRHLATLTVYLVPGLIASLLPTFVTLQDPALGALRNSKFFVHGALTTLATFTGGMLQARAVTLISHADISTLEVLAIAVVGLSHFWLVMGLLGVYWRFPVPFTMVLGAMPYTLALVWAIVLVLWRHMVRPTRVRSRLLTYLPSHAVQVFQILFYPAYSTLFEAAGQGAQILLIAIVPVCKHYIKRAVAAVSYHLGDFHREVSIAGVEICASIYQATIMQNTPTILSGVLIVLVDVVQGSIDAKLFLSIDPVVFAHGLELLQDDTKAFPDATLAPFASNHMNLCERFSQSLHRRTSRFRASGSTTQITPSTVAPTIKASKRKLSSAEDRETRAVVETLEVLQSLETILLVEFLETIAPIVNTVYLLVAAQLQSALYNPRVRSFYGDASALHSAVLSVVAYAVLQALTLGALCLFVRSRLTVSAVAVLAFVLETHVWSLQGKMIAWFSLMFSFSVIHYGVDFSFKFDFAPPS